MGKAEFLERVRAARADLNEALNGLSEEQMTQDVVTGEWTVKDILAHLAAWQEETLLSVERAERGEDPGSIIDDDVDGWNANRVAERRRLPLVDIMQEFTSTYDQLLHALDRWPSDTVPLGPASWDETSRLWWLTEHDREHVGAIRTYRRQLADR